MCISFFCSLDALDVLDDAFTLQHECPLSPLSIARFDLCIQEPWASALRALDRGTALFWTCVQIFWRFPLGSVYSMLQIADGLLFPEVACGKHQTRTTPFCAGWWFGCHFWHFPINIGIRLSSQLTHIFQRGKPTTNLFVAY